MGWYWFPFPFAACNDHTDSNYNKTRIEYSKWKVIWGGMELNIEWIQNRDDWSNAILLDLWWRRFCMKWEGLKYKVNVLVIQFLSLSLWIDRCRTRMERGCEGAESGSLLISLHAITVAVLFCIIFFSVSCTLWMNEWLDGITLDLRFESIWECVLFRFVWLCLSAAVDLHDHLHWVMVWRCDGVCVCDLVGSYSSVLHCDYN